MAMNMVINKEDGTVVFNRAQIPVGAWRNFAGGPTRFNKQNTQRFFHIFLTDEEAHRLEDAGWNVKWLENKNNPSEPKQAHLQVFIKLDGPARLQPKIWQTRKKGRPILLDGDLIGQLDMDDFERVKLQIRPYKWELDSGKSGIKAFVKQMFVTPVEDDFAAEFFDEDEERNEIPFEE